MNDVLQDRISIDLGDGLAPIVMVDDEALDFELVRRFYKSAGIPNPLIHFASGQEFLEFLKRVKAGGDRLPVLVLMDINMPRIDGFETIVEMRNDPFFKTMPLVMMLTSSTDPHDREKAAEVGVDGYLVKSFDPRCYGQFFDALKAA